MAGEFVHAEVGGELTEAEYHSLVGHELNDQARGDLIISNAAATGLARLAIGAEDSLMVAGADDPQWSTLRWSGSDLGPSADIDLLGLSAGALTVRGQADIEGYAAIGNGQAPSAARTLILDRDFTVSGGVIGSQLHVGGAILATTTVGWGAAYVDVNPGGVTLQADGNVHTMILREPDVTLDGNVAAVASTLYIVNAPTEGTSNYALWVDSGRVRVDSTIEARSGVYITTDASTNNLIDSGSNGSGSTTMYVGNQSITTSSDERIKRDIGAWEGDALALVDQFRVIDYAWDDPSDRAEVDRNSRGRWVGFSAQEAVKLAPWTVNTQGGADCALCAAAQTCEQHPNPWLLEKAELVPVAFKAIQELARRIERLEATP